MKLHSRRARWTIASAGAAVGLSAGIILGGLGIANAASSSPSSSSTTTPAATTPAATAPAGDGNWSPRSAPSGGGPGHNPLSLSGAVTAVGKDTVTIKTGSGTTTYAVTSSSDIDKNGEATLGDLSAGDAVTFSTTTSGTTVTIDKLHAGNEALDRPTGPPPGANGETPPAPPASSGTAPSA